MKVAVVTPTGNIGSALSELLCERDVDLVLLARQPEKLEALAERGAEIRAGSLADGDYLIEATRDVDAVFWLVPIDPRTKGLRAHQRTMGELAARAVRANAIARVVNLSSIGAQRDSGLGPANGLHDVEKHLDEIAENVTHLRAGSFYENHFLSLESIATAGHIYAPIPGDVRIPRIATRDIAEVAAEVLLDANWSGRRVLELEGPARLSFDEAAAAIGEGIGRPVEHVEVEEAQARSAMTMAGLSESFADALLELYRGMAAGLYTLEEGRTTHRQTSTSLEEFARTALRPALEG